MIPEGAPLASAMAKHFVQNNGVISRYITYAANDGGPSDLDLLKFKCCWRANEAEANNTYP